MEYSRLRVAVLLAVGLALSAPAGAQQLELDVREHTLDNGLKVLMLENHSIPSFTFWTFYRVGSINERPGLTGVSHLFEHMMFRGARKYGPGAFDRTMESSGGRNNAFTDKDITAYYDEMPAEGLALICELESDRMSSLNIVQQTLDPEREVVKEERRFRTENDVDGQLEEILAAAAYDAHPYQWPVVGWMADLDNITVEDCRQYFRTYYAPNNAVIVLVGDFQEAPALGLIRRSFASIPAQAPPRAVVNDEPRQKGEKRITYYKEAQVPALRVAYHVPAAGEEDFYALELLQAVLSDGRSSRLYRRLVRGAETAISVSGSNEWRRHPGLLTFSIDMRPGKQTEAALGIFDEEVERVRNDGIIENELAKAKNQLRAGFLRRLKTSNGKGEVLGEMETLFGGWRRYEHYLEKIGSATKQHVQKAARAWLPRWNRTVVTLVPEELPAEAPAANAAPSGRGEGPASVAPTVPVVMVGGGR